MKHSEKTNAFSRLMEKNIRSFFALLIWIPGLMVGWFWACFFLTFVTGD